ncbi:O-antigen/teichoic acid export membrane protein [Azospirillum agricola]|uniref:lipopolysaccharide biosynthesis protein n=1 Tax=Azospirillum agricola TaxID=1720247 RepID=UPI001AE2D84F|nr:hypothetical protein [Azospirillum agricola]MBP2227751.1 O-antigen/teichoic acid export membrane protein [Azospirillum agricola]
MKPFARRPTPFLTALTAGTGRIAQAACTALTIPLVANHLDAEEFGLWIAVTGLMAFGGVIDLGIGGDLVNRLGLAIETRDESGARRCIATAYAILLAFGALIVAGSLLAHATLPIDQWLPVQQSATAREGALALTIAVVCLGLLAPVGVVGKMRLACHESHIHYFWDTVATGLMVLSVAVACVAGGGMIALTLAITVPPVVVNVVNTILFFRRGRLAIAPTAKAADFRLALRFLRSGALFFVISVATLVCIGTDAIIALYALGGEVAAQCGVAIKLVTSLQAVIGMMLVPYWPLYAAPLAGGRVAEVWRILGRSLAMALLIALPLAAALAGFGNDILRFWVGAGIAVPAGLMLACAVWLPLYALGAATSACACNTPFVPALARIMTVATVVMVAAKIVLAEHLGPAGIVWGGVAAYPVVVLLPTLAAIAWRLRRPAATALTPATRGVG